MSGSGTRRTTILKRRAGKTARVVYYAKRGGLACLVLALTSFGFQKLVNSEWYIAKKERTAESFHARTANAGLRVRGFLIDGRYHTTREELMAATGIRKDESIFTYDLAEIQKRVVSLPWVKTATVERRLPDTIYINLVERAPVALYQKNNKLTLVDAEGAALTDKNLADFKDLIVITGEQAPQNASELIGIIDAERDFKDRIKIARWIGNRRWDIELKNDVTIRLPEEDPGLAIKRLVEAQKTEQVMDRHVEAIDLRDANRIVVQTTPGAVDKYEASFKKEKNI